MLEYDNNPKTHQIKTHPAITDDAPNTDSNSMILQINDTSTPPSDNAPPQTTTSHHHAADGRASSVVLRLEYIGKREARVLQYTVWILFLLLAFLAIYLVGTITKSRINNELYLHSEGWIIWQLVIGVVLFALMLSLASVLGWRLYSTRHMHWDRKRAMLVFNAAFILLLAVRLLPCWIFSIYCLFDIIMICFCLTF